ncbi:VOC family protein [Methylomonas methanica]|uniref:VOC family protein n=1 Tax=Methylomonas methanica TaxID=421 RepID=UPI0030828CC9
MFERESLADDARVPPVGSGFPGFSISHNVGSESEVDSILREADRAGGQRLRPGEKAPWGGFRGYFTDPDGFLGEVCYNACFPLNEQRFVQLPK